MIGVLMGFAIGVFVLGYVVYRILKAIITDYGQRRGW